MATLGELEARVAALEASHADYRAVLAAVNALGENQRELATTVRELTTTVGAHGRRLDSLETTVADFRQETRANFRSTDEQLAEIKDLIIGRREGQ
jgi:uncharacterized coiled-coil protein SlyX